MISSSQKDLLLGCLVGSVVGAAAALLLSKQVVSHLPTPSHNKVATEKEDKAPRAPKRAAKKPAPTPAPAPKAAQEKAAQKPKKNGSRKKAQPKDSPPTTEENPTEKEPTE